MGRIRKITARAIASVAVLGGIGGVVLAAAPAGATAVDYAGPAATSNPTAVEYAPAATSNPTAVEYAAPAATSNATAIEYGL
jgi:hypothetical protein